MNVIRFLALIVATLLTILPLSAEEPDRSPQQCLEYFAAEWNEDGWDTPSPQRGYLRSSDDTGWQERMLTLRGLVLVGKEAVGPLTEAAKSDNSAVRILAFQTFGYLAPHAPRDVLLAAAKSDPDAAARLYAVDSLGMQGGANLAEALAPLLKAEKNRDVRMHIRYAQERESNGIDPAVVRRLIEWDPQTMNTAKVGQPAPDFELKTISGQSIRLSQFRGKQAVVLVFIYGDT